LRAPQDGWTPLYAASFNGHAEVVGALLAQGADVEAKTNVSVTPSRMDASTREAAHTYACEMLAAATADVVT
jgi:ankyrin repeat protein